MQWNDSSRTLTIGSRKGSFPGMLEGRTFRVVFVKENHGGGGETAAKPDQTIQYSGREVPVTEKKIPPAWSNPQQALSPIPRHHGPTHTPRAPSPSLPTPPP